MTEVSCLFCNYKGDVTKLFPLAYFNPDSVVSFVCGQCYLVYIQKQTIFGDELAKELTLNSTEIKNRKFKNFLPE